MSDDQDVSPAPAEGPDRALEEFLHRITGELQQRRGRQAVQEFLDAQSQGLVPMHDRLVQWLVEHVGEEESRRLIAAFAHFPCIACEGGLETCAACEGAGVDAGPAVCEACIGGGRVRCDFCAGSGLATYNLFPPPLRRYIITHRALMARREVEKLARIKLSADPARLLEVVLGCNKLWCALENAVIAAKAVGIERPSAAPAMEELIVGCHDAAAGVEQFIRPALRALADAYASATSGETDPERARLAQCRAEYHRALADAPSFQRTLLHHPMLGTGAGDAPAPG